MNQSSKWWYCLFVNFLKVKKLLKSLKVYFYIQIMAY